MCIKIAGAKSISADPAQNKDVKRLILHSTSYTISYKLEHNVFVFLLFKHTWDVERVTLEHLLARSRGLGLFLCLLPSQLHLFLLHNFLDTEELFASLLVHLLSNVGQNRFNSRDQNIFKSIHSATGHLDLLIKRFERCLQRRQFAH